MSFKKKREVYCILLLVLLIIMVLGFTHGKEKLLSNRGECLESLSFTIKEEAAKETIHPFYSKENNVYYLFLPTYSNMADVTIYFEGAETVIFKEEADSHDLKRGMDIQCLESDQLYDAVFLKDEKVQENIQFMIMHSANLPALFIETKSGTMDAVDADKSYREKGRYTLIDIDGTLLYADQLDHITGRGNSTWNYPKKSYGIKLANPANLLNMGSAQAWILLSNVEDNTYLRNKITYDMAIEAGMAGAPESRYIDLYINNQYHGMYLLCEKIEVGENRIPMADLNLENKRLNKDMKQAEKVNTETMKCVRLGKNPQDITGGYIIERDVPSKYKAETSGFQSKTLGDLYTIKSPQYASVEEAEYIKSLFDGMERAIVSEDGIDPETGMSYLEYIDVRSFAQKYVIEELCKNNGAGATSSFFYKPDDKVSTKIFAGPVWDYDKAYAKLAGFDSAPRDLCYMTQRVEGTALFWYLNKHPEFQDAVSECYEEFFSDYIVKVVEDKTVEYASEMYASADMDVIRWKEIYGDVAPYGERSYPVKDFLMQRKEFLDEVWLQQKETCTVHFVAPEWSRDTYMSVIKGEKFIAIPMQEKGKESNGRIFDGWYTEDGEEFDMTQSLYEDVTVYARGHEAPLKEE